MRITSSGSLFTLAVCCWLTGWPVLAETSAVADSPPAKSEAAKTPGADRASTGDDAASQTDISARITRTEEMIRKIDQEVPGMLKVSGWPTLTGYFQNGKLAKAIMDEETYWYNAQGLCFAYTSTDNFPELGPDVRIRCRFFQDDVDAVFAMGREDHGYKMEPYERSAFEDGDAYPPGTAKQRLDYLLSLDPKGIPLPTTWTMNNP
ncbi:MAG TPA: hypothetical protein PKO06_13810, partial [Candidatus Ozemobacteraceae bacterium]|nr:hypothetical protein [Candidatus Ozemobacteraceae bacterium]